VIIIEHNLDIIRNADYILDLGPEGGERGGRIIAHGTPEQIATVAGSHTGSFLARHYATANGTNGLGAAIGLGSRSGANSNGQNPYAGAQPMEIAAPDRVKGARGKFVAPEKKTGVPTARAVAPPKVAAKKAPAKSAKKAGGVKKAART
jgi:excinuclease ABC subunit A